MCYEAKLLQFLEIEIMMRRRAPICTLNLNSTCELRCIDSEVYITEDASKSNKLGLYTCSGMGSFSYSEKRDIVYIVGVRLEMNYGIL